MSLETRPKISKKQSRSRHGIFAMLLAGVTAVALSGSILADDIGVLTDAEITSAVETQMLRQHGVPVDRIQVQTEKGIVTLTGLVYHVLAKERAAEIARSVRGVRGVVNRIAVLPPERPDRGIRQDVIRSLYVNPATEGKDVQVWVQDGKVTLTGTVQSLREKQLVHRVSQGVMGVVEVDNQIVVRPPDQRLDPELRAEIEESLRWDTLVDGALVAVSVDSGRAALAGVVGSAREKERAIELAWIDGVTEVDAKDLVIDPGARREELRANKYAPRTDDEIRAALERVFEQDPRVRPFHPQLSVRNGIVTLRGVVDDLGAKRAAEDDARNVVGVWHVRNLLKVRPGEPVSDEETAENVREALRLDPYVQRRDIHVEVLDGEAFLEGTVGSSFEKKRAESAASVAAGVVAVHNRLSVAEDSADPERSDWQIEQDVEQELFWSPFVDADEIDVEVDGGVATLTGTVDTWMEWKSAAENALEGGAAQVDNQLDVRYGPESRQAR